MPAPTQIFISYARKDGRPFAAELRQKLEGLDFSIWQDVVSMESGDDWWLQIKKAIENVQTLVLVLTEAALQSEIVRREWVYARSVGIHILPVTSDPSIFDKAPRWMSKLDIAILAPSHPDYDETSGRFIRQLHNPPPRKPVPFMAEALPLHFTRRETVQDIIKTRLLDDSRANPRPGVVTLLGMGGFGKTTLAQAVCYDPEIADVYTGGVLYATIGESGADITAKINAMVSALKGTSAVFNTREEAARALHELLADRDCLMVLDDVWDEEHIKPFLANDGCARIITTRDPQIAALATQNPVEITEMLPKEAAALLLEYLPEDKHPPQQDGLLNLAKRLGEWPLLLGIFGGTLRQEVMVHKRSLTDALDWLNEGLSEEGLTVFDGSSKEGRNHALEASMNASLRRYDEAEKYRLYELAIFRDDTEIPEAVAVKLWEQTAKLSRFKAEKLLRRLAGQFFQLRAVVEGGAQTLRLHDAMRLYLRGQLGDRYQSTHQTLLNAYNPTPEKAWHEAADSYLCDHLVYHLIEAQRADELPKLFANHDWMHKRFEQSGYTYTGFLDDLTQAWEIAHAEALRQIDVNEEPTAIAQCIRYALIQTSINSIAANYPPELVARAVETGLWTPKRAIGLTQQIPSLEKRVEIYAAILTIETLDVEWQSAIQKIGLETALAIEQDSNQAKSLKSLRLTGDFLQRSLDAALAIENQFYRSDVLQALIPQLDEVMLSPIIDSVLAIEDEENRIQLLILLGKHYPPDRKAEILMQALDMVLSMESGRLQLNLLIDLAQCLEGEQKANIFAQALDLLVDDQPNSHEMGALLRLAKLTEGQQKIELLNKAVGVALSFEDEGSRFELLGSLINELDTDLPSQIMDVVLIINRESYRARLIQYLAKKLEGKELEQAIEAAYTLSDARDRALVFSALIPRVIDEQKTEIRSLAIENTIVIDDSRTKAEILVELSESLEGEYLEVAIKAAMDLSDPHDKSKALKELAKRINGERKQEILSAALEAAISSPHISALVNLTDQLEGNLLDQALSISLEIKDDSKQSIALGILAQSLEGECKIKALTYGFRGAQKVTHQPKQVEAFKLLFSQFDEDLLRGALETTQANSDDYWRVKILGSFIERVSLEQRRTIVRHELEEIKSKTPSRFGGASNTLRVLVRYLPDDLLDDTLDIVLGLGQEDLNYPIALKSLAPRLHGDQLTKALEAALAIKQVLYRVDVLIAFVKQLKGEKQTEIIAEIFKAISEFDGTSKYAQLLADLVSQVEGSQKEVIVARAWEAAKSMDFSLVQVDVLNQLVKNTDEEQKRLIATYALETTLRLNHDGRKITELVKLAAHVDPEQKEEILESMLNLYPSIDDEGEQVEILGKLFPHLSDAQRLKISPEIYRKSAMHLRKIKVEARSEILSFLAAESLFTSPLFSPDTLGQIAEHIIDVCNNWRWQ